MVKSVIVGMTDELTVLESAYTCTYIHVIAYQRHIKQGKAIHHCQIHIHIYMYIYTVHAHIHTYLLCYLIGILSARPFSKLIVVLEVIAIHSLDIAHFIHVSHEEGLQGGEMAVNDAVGLGEELGMGDHISIAVYYHTPGGGEKEGGGTKGGRKGGKEGGEGGRGGGRGREGEGDERGGNIRERGREDGGYVRKDTG